MLPRRNQAENQGKIEFFRDLVLNLTQIRIKVSGLAPVSYSRQSEVGRSRPGKPRRLYCIHATEARREAKGAESTRAERSRKKVPSRA